MQESKEFKAKTVVLNGTSETFAQMVTRKTMVEDVKVASGWD